MKGYIKIIIAYIRGVIMIPQILFLFFNDTVRKDTIRWKECHYLKFNIFTTYLYLLTYYKEFRNLVYNRTGYRSILTPRLSSLYIRTKDIGEGLYIQHGYATGINAKKIGKNCWINQKVTIGSSNKTDAPIIGDNVTIYTGAIVIGGITIGDNSIIGAGAIVVDDVPANSVVCGPKARVIKIDGHKV